MIQIKVGLLKKMKIGKFKTQLNMNFSNFELVVLAILGVLIIYFAAQLISGYIVDKEMDDFKKKNGLK